MYLGKQGVGRTYLDLMHPFLHKDFNEEFIQTLQLIRLGG